MENEQIPKQFNVLEKLLPSGKKLEDIEKVKLNTQNGELKIKFTFIGDEDIEDTKAGWIKVKAESPMSQMTAMKDIADVFGNKIEIDDGDLN